MQINLTPTATNSVNEKSLTLASKETREVERNNQVVEEAEVHHQTRPPYPSLAPGTHLVYLANQNDPRGLLGPMTFLLLQYYKWPLENENYPPHYYSSI